MNATPSSFSRRLEAAQRACRSVLCVGLDPDPDRLPAPFRNVPLPEAIGRFTAAIIDATAGLAAAYKLNLAFFEILGAEGWRVLERTLARIPDDVLTIADAKRGDIGNSARFYARALFEELPFDAVTVAPYMGEDSVAPFLEHPGRAAFVLARTSNPGAADFQELEVDGERLYERVARSVAAWGNRAAGEAGLVVGATDVEPLARLRKLCPTLPFLIPGVGTQGGDARAVLDAAQTAAGAVLVNSSRQILYASDGSDFEAAAAREAALLRDQLPPF